MKPEQKQLFRMICSYAVLVGAALAAAINYELFVLPNSFAPAGVNGICTLIQKVFGINIGYMSILINMPLAVLVYLKVSKTLAVRSSLYILIFSVSLVILEKTDLSFLQYYTENGTSRILGPLTAGIVMGCIYAMLLRVGAFTGGTDFVSALIHAKHPGKSVFFLSFILNSIVAGCSFFVYDYKIEPILLCILYSFASTTIADKAMRSGRSAVRFEIITGKE
ncbi:MAG: YitT family protein, partial [Clostridia bacterium]|nr:YitT family protein [Clostridia bacterium]